MFLLEKYEKSECTCLSSVVAFWWIYSHSYVICKLPFILHVIQLSSPGSDFLHDVYLIFSQFSLIFSLDCLLPIKTTFMWGFKLSHNEMQFLIYLYKEIKNPNSHQLMLNEWQVKHPKITFILFELLLSQPMKKTKSRHKKLLSVHHNTKLICISTEHLLDRKQINQVRYL